MELLNTAPRSKSTTRVDSRSILRRSSKMPGSTFRSSRTKPIFAHGRFDIPFSRNELTSDSKLLLMDRTLIKEAVTAVGMCDKQYGVMLHGRPNCGRWEYDVGVFDSNVFEKTARWTHARPIS